MSLDQQEALNLIIVQCGKKKRDAERPVLKLHLHLQSQLPVIFLVA